MWNYLFYIYNLELIDITDYNGIESYIADKMAKDDISWFPIGKSISIKDEN